MNREKIFTALWMLLWIPFRALVASEVQGASFETQACRDVFDRSERGSFETRALEGSGPLMSADELSVHVRKKITQVLEFEFIRELADQQGVRVWLFGGTASSFLHYAKWDLASSRGLLDLQRDRFDYDFTHIFRSTQDIDIVIDAPVAVAKNFQSLIAQRFPHFLGDKENRWEVRTLRTRIGEPGKPGYKEALLNDSDFHYQNTDSNSIGMVEVTEFNREPVVRDLKNWDSKESIFLEDALRDRISFFRSNRHYETSRAQAGENPEILSALRILVKAFQYQLSLSNEDFIQIKNISDEFNPKTELNPTARRRIQDTAKKLVIHAVNLEYAMNLLQQLGLRRKLISMGNIGQKDSFAWWLNREPLRSKPIGEKKVGPTARELNIEVVAHETNHFLSSESIIRSHSGEPNVLISRQSAVGEAASYGDGFYTVLGRASSVRGTGITIRFRVDPSARLGSDFTMYQGYIIFKNKKALKVIPESLYFDLEDLIRLSDTQYEVEIDPADRRLLEMHRRRLSSAKILKEVDRLFQFKTEADFEKIVKIITAIHSPNVSQLISDEVRLAVVKSVSNLFFSQVRSTQESELEQYIRIVGSMIETLDSTDLLRKGEFITTLKGLIQNPALGIQLRKEAVYELLMVSDRFEAVLDLRDHFSPFEMGQIKKEVWGWHGVSNFRKKRSLLNLYQRWVEAIEKADIEGTLVPLLRSGLFDLNAEALNQKSILQFASYFKQSKILEWLIQCQEFNFNAINQWGYTEVEQLLLNGKKDWVDEIQKRRPEVQFFPFSVSERDLSRKTSVYPQGVPITDFIRIEPGNFLMGNAKNKVFATITQPFEFMSVDTTQGVYRRVIELFKFYLSGEFQDWTSDPTNSSYVGESYPVNGIRFDEVNFWITGLNQLSKLDKVGVQEELKKLFPKHQKGDFYHLPSEAQWEMVSRLGGLADRDYSHGKNETDLDQYAVYDNHSSVKLLPVGSKKPVFYQGHPIYDLHGLVWRWISDHYSKRPSGGVDPQGPAAGALQVLRGGSFLSNSNAITSASRFYSQPDSLNPAAGFRLIRVLK